MKITICGQEYSELDVSAALAKDAIQAQDACNLSGIIFSLPQVMQALCDHPACSGLAWRNHHPIIVLYLNKLDSLCTGDFGDTTAFSKAYDLCRAAIEQEAA